MTSSMSCERPFRLRELTTPPGNHEIPIFAEELGRALLNTPLVSILNLAIFVAAIFAASVKTCTATPVSMASESDAANCANSLGLPKAEDS